MREELKKALENVYTPEEVEVIANSVKLANCVSTSYGICLGDFASEVASRFDLGLEKTASFEKSDDEAVAKIAAVGFSPEESSAIVYAVKQARTVADLYKAAGYDVNLKNIAVLAEDDAREKNRMKVALAQNGYSKEEALAIFRGE